MDDADLASPHIENGVKRGVEAIQSNLKSRSGVLICIQCHEEIPKKRLDAYPSTDLCIDCQKWREKGGGFWP